MTAIQEKTKMRPTSPLRLALALALAHSARTALDLPPCQSRCYTMTAGLIGCGAEDYACHCAAFDARFAPQMSSCMIEGCAFDNETPLGMCYFSFFGAGCPLPCRRCGPGLRA